MKILTYPAFSVQAGANVKVIGETGAGKSSSIEHLVYKTLQAVLKRRIGRYKSTITQTIIHLNSAAPTTQIGFIGEIKNSLFDKNKLQQLIIKALVEMSFANSEHSDKVVFIEYLKHSFANGKNTDAVLMLLTPLDQNEVFELIANFFDKNEFLTQLNIIYNETIPKLDKFEKDSVKLEALTTKIQNEISKIFQYNTEAFEEFKKIYNLIESKLEQLILDLFKVKVNSNTVSLIIEFDENGNPKEKEDLEFYNYFFKNNNSNDVSIELLFEKVHLELPMSEELLATIENHPNKDYLKFGNSYRINYLDHQGLFHKEQDQLLVLDELTEQMNKGKADLCLNFINLSKNILLEDTINVYTRFMSENRMSRHNIFIFTHLDMFLFDQDDIDSVDINALIRNQTSNFVTQIYSKSKVKNYSIVEFSNDLKKLSRFSDEIDISEYTPSAFIISLIDSLTDALSYRQKVPTFEIPNLNGEIKLNLDDEEKINSFSKAIGDYFEVPQYNEHKNKSIKPSINLLKKQYGLKPLYRSWVAVGRRVSYCGAFRSEIISSRYDAYDNIDTEFLVGLPKLISEDFKNYMVNYLFKYVVAYTADLTENDLNQLKTTTVRYLDERSILGNIVMDFYNISNEHWTTELIYKSFLTSIENFISGDNSILFMHKISEYTLLEFKKAFERAIWIHMN